MDPLTAVAAGGLRSRMETLDLIANNLANSSAPGFKADREFYNLYISAEADAGPGQNLPSQPLAEKRWTDFSQGSLSPTGNPLDLGLTGKGFFAINSPGGPLLTRDGSFQLSSSGQIQTKEGYALRDKKGQPIRVDVSKSVEIGPDGSVRQDGVALARIDLVDVADSNSLVKQGQNYFSLSSSDPTTVPAAAEVQQGKVESANVQPAEAAVHLVTVMRQFEILQKALSIGADMNKRAIDDVARVS